MKEAFTSQTTSDRTLDKFYEKGLVGIQLGHEQFPITELLELGVAAEQAGFDVITSSDHFQPWQANEAHSSHAWVFLGAMSQRTKRIMMGTTVTCPTFRYSPPVVAEGFSSLSRLAPGRIFLGVGSGEALNEEAATGEWPKWPERSERLVEATEIIRKMWKGGQVEHTGKYYKVNARLYDTPAQPVPLLMAGNGPKAMRRCGQYADGLITDPNTWKQHRSEFEAAAKAEGKDPSKMPVYVEALVVVGGQQEAEYSAKMWRFIPKAWDPYFNLRDPKEIEDRANKEVDMQELMKEWTISTDPDVHVKKLNELFNGGATEVHIHSGQRDQRRVIDFYGNEVLPRLRRKKAA